MFKLDLEKADEPEIKLPTSVGSSKKQESSRKTSTSALLTMPKPLTVWITTNCRKFLKRWEYQTTWSASWEICMQVKKQQSSTKTFTCFIDYAKPLTVWITANCGKLLKKWEYETTWPPSWEICMQVKKQEFWTRNNRLVPNRKRSTSRLYIVTLLI